MTSGNLDTTLSEKTSFLGLKLCFVIGLCVGAFIILILGILSVWVTFRRKSRRTPGKYSHFQIPNVSKDIRVDRVGGLITNDESVFLSINEKSSDKNSEKMFVHLGRSKSSDVDNIGQCSSMYHHESVCSSQSGEE